MLHILRRAVAFPVLTVAFASMAHAQEVVIFVTPRPLPADVTPRVQMSACGVWTGFYGPIDYRTAQEPTRRRVESHHFDEYIPRFLSWSVNRPFDIYIATNLSYTLRSFPNHPTSLTVMEQIGRRLGTDKIPGSSFPLECWYLRALQTVPDDPIVRAQYGIYLAHRGRAQEARANLDVGDRGLCTSRTMQYQIGLANHALGAFELAQRNAMRAERMGFSLPLLKKLLVDGKKWNDAVTLPESPTMDCVLETPATPEPDLLDTKK